MHLRFLIMVCLVLTAIVSSSAKEIPVGLTISGGTSYGSYQAGFLYAAHDWLRVNDNTYKVRVITGTSAGSINAILSALSLSHADTVFTPDTASLFYKIWIPLSFDTLNCGKSALSALGRDFFDTLRNKVMIPYVNDRRNNGPLDIVLGITTTYLNAIDTKLSDDLNAPAGEQKFTVRITNKGDGIWQFRNYIDSSSNQPVAVLPLNLHDSSATDSPMIRNFKTIANIAYASTGIPGAFDPIPIKHIQVVPQIENTKPQHVNWLDTGTTSLWDGLIKSLNYDTVAPLFVDGGVFDKSPLRFAADVACNGLDTNCNWADKPNWKAANPVVDSMLFIYLSQDNIRFPELKAPVKCYDNSLFGTLMSMCGNLIKSAHSKELSILNERFPNLDPLITQNCTPLMSGYLFDFLGFFEKPFRIFDFYTGMYDADRFLRKKRESGLNVGSKSTGTKFTKVESYDKRYQLTKRVLDLIYNTVDLCKDSEFKPGSAYWKSEVDSVNCWFKRMDSDTASEARLNFERHAIMLQTSIDRLWARWRCAINSDSIVSADSVQINAWKRMIAFRPTFFTDSLIPQALSEDDYARNIICPDSLYIKGAKENASNSEFDQLLFLLHYYGYVYEDIIPAKRALASTVKKELCDKLLATVRNLARHQHNRTEGRVYLNMSKPLMNLFACSPSKYGFRIGFGAGGLMLDYNHVLAKSGLCNKFQMDFCGNIEKGSEHNLGTKRGQIDPSWYPSFAFNHGFLFEIWGNAVWQLRYGFSAGIGKNWTHNSTSDSLLQKWTINGLPLILQGSLYETFFLRFSYGGEGCVDFSNYSQEPWRWRLFRLQLGIQLVR